LNQVSETINPPPLPNSTELNYPKRLLSISATEKNATSLFWGILVCFIINVSICMQYSYFTKGREMGRELGTKTDKKGI